MPTDHWKKLDGLLQLSYSVNDAHVIYSIHQDDTWSLFVFASAATFTTSHNEEEAMGGYLDLISFGWLIRAEKRLQRPAGAETPSAFIDWAASNVTQGRLHVALLNDKATLRIGDTPKDSVLLVLQSVEDDNEPRWNLFTKLALHVQKQHACHIDDAFPSSNENVPSINVTDPSLSLSVQGSLHSTGTQSSQPEGKQQQFLPTSSQEQHHATSSPPTTASLSVVRKKRKGMSLINPRVRRVARNRMQFEETPSSPDETKRE